MAFLSWEEIQERAHQFAQEFQSARDEKSQAQTFWLKFFAIFGVDSHRVGVFERRVQKLNKNIGYADYLWPGVLLIEHKSANEDLMIAQDQAEAYCINLKPEEHPRYLLVCNFQHFWLKDLQEGIEHRFELHELPHKISLFGFISGRKSAKVVASDPINEEAVQKLAQLHTALRRDGYKRHPLQVLLVRLLFCMFADKTGLFEPAGRFTDLIESGTLEDGSNVGQVLNQLFDELDTELGERQKKLPGWFKNFPFVNGQLFAEKIRTASFDAPMRQLLLQCCYLDWARISPAIFGSMFQHVMDMEGLDTKNDLRRELGAHYTSEENILKLIDLLFLDELKAEFESAKDSIHALFELQKKLRRLRFLDPACGCGNFLVITYRELRLLEVAIFKAVKTIALRSATYLSSLAHTPAKNIKELDVFRYEMINVDQFYGIEIEEFPSHVARVALWLVDHQMNMLMGETLECWMARLPLEHSASIRTDDALALDWKQVCPPEHLNYILGNPPFVGKQLQNDLQKQSMERLLATTGAADGTGIAGGGILDFVTGWYIKATQYLIGDDNAAQALERKKAFKDAAFANATQASIMEEPLSPAQLAAQKSLDDLYEQAEAANFAAREKIKVAFISTNSICQGEQVGVLWRWLQQQGIAIEFAHRTFKWSNEASGNAAVHCVIVGFGLKSRVEKITPKRLFDYFNDMGEVDPTGKPVESLVEHINPYLVEAATPIFANRRNPLCDVPPMFLGSAPKDGGHLLFNTAAEKEEFLTVHPQAAAWIRPFVGSDEFINNIPRWCLWLKDVSTLEWSQYKLIKQRVNLVKRMRLASPKIPTQEWAKKPFLFVEDRQPTTDYLLIPGVSSELRQYIPIGFLTAATIASNATFVIPNATLYHFGILTSAMHMAWMRYTCGRLKSDYRYSARIVYNNYPWPQAPSSKAYKAIEAAAQAVLDARAIYQSQEKPASFAELYAPDFMPLNLRQAHAELDTLVDRLYGLPRGKTSDAMRVALLFKHYETLVNLS